MSRLDPQQHNRAADICHNLAGFFWLVTIYFIANVGVLDAGVPAETGCAGDSCPVSGGAGWGGRVLA